MKQTFKEWIELLLPWVVCLSVLVAAAIGAVNYLGKLDSYRAENSELIALIDKYETEISGMNAEIQVLSTKVVEVDIYPSRADESRVLRKELEAKIETLLTAKRARTFLTKLDNRYRQEYDLSPRKTKDECIVVPDNWSGDCLSWPF